MQTSAALLNSPGAFDRRMIRCQLMGSRCHRSANGFTVHICRRGRAYVARGYYQKRRFLETLGHSQAEAEERLRHLLIELDARAYVPPSEARKRAVASAVPPRLTLRQLVNSFVTTTREQKGQRTADNYENRLRPILEFAEFSECCKRWPVVQLIDRNFVESLCSSLRTNRVTPNGRPGAQSRIMAAGTMVNVLECLRTLLNWAKRVGKLPATWIDPVAAVLIRKAQSASRAKY